MRPLPPKANQLKESFRGSALRRLIAGSATIIALVLLLENWLSSELRSPLDPTLGVYLPGLQMQGGDPYIRALMRTISASEANDPQPYTILYGGQHISDLSHHPERCITIVSGPNTGNCSTAAGRYQLLNTTWRETARRYHPQPSRFIFWQSYSFEPQFQDAVVHTWLSDRGAWGSDIPRLLRQGKLDRVFWLCSGCFLALGRVWGMVLRTIQSHGVCQWFIKRCFKRNYEQWVINDKGEVVLTATAPTVTPHNPWMTPPKCHAPQTSS